MADFEHYEQAIREQLADKPARLEHSLGVAGSARELAMRHGVDADDAYVAGLLHDWGKAYSGSEAVRRARELGIEMGEDLSLVAALLHGPIAARELGDRFPELGQDVLSAIERHTIGAVDMSPLDIVIFVADAIEPNRKAMPAIVELREAARTLDLDELFWLAFRSSVGFVVETGRYLYPGTLSIYNEIALARREVKENR